MTKIDIKLSSDFKAQSTRAILSILLFILTYLLLLLFAVALTAACMYAGVKIIVYFPRFITIIVGLGLAGMGVFILIFLLKFVFQSYKIDRSHLTEIKKAEEPELFSLIYDIVKEVGTRFPKKVYLSTDVNASVFYDSSFWSMFLPIKKNLQIGVGLVNTVSRAELKAILSHEFGHFSQRSMKVGSYVYNVNQIIYNLLYNNTSYQKLTQEWANTHWAFLIFMSIARGIVELIQGILKILYGVVNKSYMGLSRQMEFQADEIAARVTGFEPLKSSLLRMTFADQSFQDVLSFYEGKIAENLKSENVYREQAFVMKLIAADRDIPVVNGLPEITMEEFTRFRKSKLVVKDQWASHPGTIERIERLEQTGISAKLSEHVPANEVFRDAEEIQKALTGKIFDNVRYKDEVAQMPFVEFQSQFREDYLKNTFSKIYNGYYNMKQPGRIEIIPADPTEEHIHLEELFSDEKVNLVYTVVALQKDIEGLKHIAAKRISIQTFDYDGQRYTREESTGLLSRLGEEIKQMNERIMHNDIRIHHFFRECERAQHKPPQLDDLYREFFQFDKEYDAWYLAYSELSKKLQFINHATSHEEIQNHFRQLESQEMIFKDAVKKMLANSRFQEEITGVIKENLELYLSHDWVYYTSDQYEHDNLGVLFTAMHYYTYLLSRAFFLQKKKLLDYQAALIETPEPVPSAPTT